MPTKSPPDYPAKCPTIGWAGASPPRPPFFFILFSIFVRGTRTSSILIQSNPIHSVLPFCCWFSQFRAILSRQNAWPTRAFILLCLILCIRWPSTSNSHNCCNFSCGCCRGNWPCELLATTSTSTFSRSDLGHLRKRKGRRGPIISKEITEPNHSLIMEQTISPSLLRITHKLLGFNTTFWT
jgi:hypothetical protein